jgi:hypothetical protein
MFRCGIMQRMIELGGGQNHDPVRCDGQADAGPAKARRLTARAVLRMPPTPQDREEEAS